MRASLSDEVRDYMDRLGQDSLKGVLRTMRDVAACNGWENTAKALKTAFAAAGRIDEASVGIAAAALSAQMVEYDERVDLSVYDRAIAQGRL